MFRESRNWRAVAMRPIHQVRSDPSAAGFISRRAYRDLVRGEEPNEIHLPQRTSWFRPIRHCTENRQSHNSGCSSLLEERDLVGPIPCGRAGLAGAAHRGELLGVVLGSGHRVRVRGSRDTVPDKSSSSIRRIRKGTTWKHTVHIGSGACGRHSRIREYPHLGLQNAKFGKSFCKPPWIKQLLLLRIDGRHSRLAGVYGIRRI